MGLTAYRRKRDFRRTAEPRGKAGPRRKGGALSYFIQRHAASRLHYDVRLELDGVLKSWAVPKGPSFDPAERRLAVHVEDHPMAYGTFEGEIPEGEYGGGTVLLWDLGRWIPQGDPGEGYRKGRLKFRLEGRKLRGAWTLVRMMGPRSENGKNWLLIKERDETARAGWDVTAERPESVKDREPPGKRAALPATAEPQLATLAAEAPAGEDWVHEIKYDGYRILARVEDGRVRLFSRNGLDWTPRFKEQAKALQGLSARAALLDGEMVVLEDKGRSDFQLLQNALSEERTANVVYFAFDLLHLDGLDLRGEPLLERKARLAELLSGGGGLVRPTEHVRADGPAFHAQACRHGLEGIICKRADAPYRAGRGADWLKVKCLAEQEFVVAGWTEPGGSRSRFGALALGVREKGELRYAGRVGTGFTQASLKEIHERLTPLETEKAPFAVPRAETRGVHWVRPELVAQVAFTGWTREGILRHPSFKGLRDDKAANAVKLEKAVKLKPRRAPVSKRGDEFFGVRISSPDRVVYPEVGLTKLDVARYYAGNAERVLREAGRRPLAIVRCPQGRAKFCFFQKHATDGFPETIRSFPILEKDGGTKDYLYVDSPEGLLALVQFGALELHPWGSRVDDVERPDRLIFDLDPNPDVPWSAVVDGARHVRKGLEAMGLAAFLKTTGGKGLHVVAPLDGKAKWPEAKEFARNFALGMAAARPDLYTAKLAKAARGGRIFVDYLRNERGSTAVSAWSTRARPGAPVSVPIEWGELKGGLKSDRWNVGNVGRRLARRVDPWSGFEASRRALPKLR